MGNFASRLSQRIRENEMFRADYTWLCSKGILTLIGNDAVEHPVLSEDKELIKLVRLVESASCMVLDENTESQKLAQTIALYGVVSSSVTVLTQACEHILTQLGNFPAADFVRARQENKTLLLPSYVGLKDYARRQFNTVDFSGEPLALTDFQHEIWEDLQTGKSAAISAPTSAGKSFVVREFVIQKIRRSQKISLAYVVPTRALMAEVQEKMAAELVAEEKTLRVTSVPVSDAQKRERQVFVVTQERLLSYLDETPDVGFDCVIVDEAQQMGDGSRGMILQECLERITGANPACILYFLSPGASGIGHLGNAVGKSDIALHVAKTSPVISSLIVVKFDAKATKRVILELMVDGSRIPLASLVREHGFADTRSRFAAVCMEFGACGGSLIYASGPVDAEKVALQIATNSPTLEDPVLLDLADFVRVHVHKDYSLAYCILRGVAFHYGSMPTLLRQGLEDAFKKGHISYLACTTTLFHGINLPTRNVFIDKVTRGNAGQLGQQDIWNFVGRAGRLKHDLAGNVFLVDYDNWPAKLLDKSTSVDVKPALSHALESGGNLIEEFLNSLGKSKLPTERKNEIEAASGLLLSRYRNGLLSLTLSRCAPQMRLDEATRLDASLQKAADSVTIPRDILERNWLISPWKLQRLYEFLTEQTKNRLIFTLIPTHPMNQDSYQQYERIFGTLEKYLQGVESEKWIRYLNYQANRWMKGAKLSELVEKALAFKQSSGGKSTTNKTEKLISNTEVRQVFDLVEKQLRFKYVQLTRAYCDCLKAVLLECGLADAAERIFPVSLALELGACTQTMVSLIELGLSRISAQSISELMLGSELTAEGTRKWLGTRSEKDLLVSAVVVDELKRLRLLKS